MIEYEDFLKQKQYKSLKKGFETAISNPYPFKFQKLIIEWALEKGRAAIFADTGLGKTIMQAVWADEVSKHEQRPVLILAPLAVAKQTVNEANKFDVDIKYVREMSEISDTGVYITNYDRLHLFDADAFAGVVLDESSILKSFTGKTTNDLISRFEHTQYKLCCTATPSPNDYTELGTTSEFLGVKRRSEMLAEFFINDITNGTGWRLKKHSEVKFYEWIATWGMFIKRPADLGYPMDGYDLPPLNIKEIVLESEADTGFLFPVLAETLTERREARKLSLDDRVEKAVEIIDSKPEENFLVWCDYNNESTTLHKAIDGSVEVTGSDKAEKKEQSLIGFANNEFKYLVSKPQIAGYGMNWQNCSNMIFCGLSDSFEMFYQAIRRCYRFGQKKEVTVYVILSEKEINVLKNIKDKQRKHDEMSENMQKIMNRIIEKEIHKKEFEDTEYEPTQEMMTL